MSTYTTATYAQAVYGPQPGVPNGHLPGTLTWLLQVDWTASGEFGEPIEPTAIQHIRWQRGARANLAGDGAAALRQPGDEAISLRLRDGARRYDPTNPASPLAAHLGRPNLPMRVLLLSGSAPGQAQPVFSGSLQSARYDAATQTATLMGEGPASLLQTPISAPGMPFNGGAWDPAFVQDGSTPAPVNYWSGQPGGLGLVRCALIIAQLAGFGGQVLANNATMPAAQLPFLPITGASAWQTLCDVAGAFGARLFFLRDGSLFLLPPDDPYGQHPGQDLPAAALHPGQPISANADAVRNSAEVEVNPISVPAFTAPLGVGSYGLCWAAQGPIAVAPASQLLLDLRFGDAGGRVFAANMLRANTDDPSDPSPLRINSQADGAGTDMAPTAGTAEASFGLVSKAVGSNALGIVYAQVGGLQTGCRVRLRNYSGTRTAYFFNLRVGGAGMSRPSQQTGALAAAQANASVAAFGKRTVSLRNGLIQTPALARAAAHALLRATSTLAYARLGTLDFSLRGDALQGALTQFEPGGHVRLPTDGIGSNGLAGRHLLLGTSLEWHSASGQSARVGWVLQKAQPVGVRLAGISQAAASGQTSLQWQHTSALAGRVLLLVAIGPTSGSCQVANASLGGQPLARLCHVGGAATGQPRAELWLGGEGLAGNAELNVAVSGAGVVQATALTLANTHASAPVGANPATLFSSGDAEIGAGAALPDGALFIGIACAAESPLLADGVDLSEAQTAGWHALAATNYLNPALRWEGAISPIAAAGALLLPAEG